MRGLILILLATISCKGEKSPQDVPSQSSSISDVELTNWHNLLNSKAYSGYIAVMFNDDTDVRLQKQEEGEDGPFVSLNDSTSLFQINKRINEDESKVMTVLRGVSRFSEDTIAATPFSDTVVSGIRYDMDRDGHAELISFSRDHKWYIDLSSVSCESEATCGEDGYGKWDVILNTSNSISKYANGKQYLLNTDSCPKL